MALGIELQTVALQFLALLKSWRQCLANQGSATASASSWRAAFLSWPPYDAARGAAYKNFWPAPGPLQPLLLRRRTNFGALRVQDVNAASAAQRKEQEKRSHRRRTKLYSERSSMTFPRADPDYNENAANASQPNYTVTNRIQTTMKGCPLNWLPLDCIDSKFPAN